MACGYPDPETAERELRLAGSLNPGPWVGHSYNTGQACRSIAARHPGLDADKAYALGVLHDIGRRVGVVTTRHGLEGYRYALSKGWDDVAKICLTHSYILHHVESEIGTWDVSSEERPLWRSTSPLLNMTTMTGCCNSATAWRWIAAFACWKNAWWTWRAAMAWMSTPWPDGTPFSRSNSSSRSGWAAPSMTCCPASRRTRSTMWPAGPRRRPPPGAAARALDR